MSEKSKTENKSKKVSAITFAIIGGITAILTAVAIIISIYSQNVEITKVYFQDYYEDVIFYAKTQTRMDRLDRNRARIVSNNTDLDEYLKEIGFIHADPNDYFSGMKSGYKYAVTVEPVNECTESGFRAVNVGIVENKLSYTLSYDEFSRYRDNCGTDYYAFIIPISPREQKKLKNNQEYIDLTVTYKQTGGSATDYPPMVDKPVIYLYPTDETQIDLRFANPEKLSTSYPKYEDGWSVIAKPNGDLIDLKTGRELYSLYWEGKDYDTKIQDEGFVIKGEDSAAFLEEKLALLGLNSRESEEFIIYWLPKLEANTYNYIHFETTEDMDEYMPLELSVKPDTKIRIAMSFKGLEEAIDVIPQELSAPERTGFTLVEWGGHEIR